MRGGRAVGSRRQPLAQPAFAFLAVAQPFVRLTGSGKKAPIEGAFACAQAPSGSMLATRWGMTRAL